MVEGEMSKLLYIKASPRGDRAHSTSVAQAFVDAYRTRQPADEIAVLDVFKMDLPPFDGLTVEAKYVILHGEKHGPEHRAAWSAVEKIIEEFKSADKYVLSTPMWNFNIPYKLKHYIDILVQPGYTFSFSPEEGYKGLVVGKPLLVVYARGGQYPPGTDYEAFDLQTKYIELIMRFMGFTDIRPLIVEPTLMDPAAAKQKKDNLIAGIDKLAAEF